MKQLGARRHAYCWRSSSPSQPVYWWRRTGSSNPHQPKGIPQMEKQDLMRIYQFWFGEQPCTDAEAGERVRFWMEQSDETDEVIRRRFGHLIAAAAAQDWAPEQLSRKEAIALVVLFDQFP